MSSQPNHPGRYENYPPEQGSAPSESFDDPPPQPAPVVRAYAPTPSYAQGGTTRRGMVGLVLAVPIVAFVAMAWRSSQDSRESWNVPMDEATPWDPANDPTAPVDGSAGDVMVGGRYRVSVPKGWKYSADGGGGVEFTKATNRLSASAIDVPPSTRATDEIEILVRSHRKGFAGKLSSAVDASTADGQQASLKGKGTFSGKPATLLARLWIDETGSGLLTTTILTADPSTAVAGEAKAMVGELSANF